MAAGHRWLAAHKKESQLSSSRQRAVSGHVFTECPYGSLQRVAERVSLPSSVWHERVLRGSAGAGGGGGESRGAARRGDGAVHGVAGHTEALGEAVAGAARTVREGGTGASRGQDPRPGGSASRGG